MYEGCQSEEGAHDNNVALYDNSTLLLDCLFPFSYQPDVHQLSRMQPVYEVQSHHKDVALANKLN